MEKHFCKDYYCVLPQDHVGSCDRPYAPSKKEKFFPTQAKCVKCGYNLACQDSGELCGFCKFIMLLSDR